MFFYGFCSYENLKATMEKVNEYAKTGVDAEFGRKKEPGHYAAVLTCL